ncbi:helix-turn-helix transcriptional regulator [Brevundimonas sp. NIBR11]|uniref:helix-turn-helix domain-containing protein n=1 Tax=Brevundimonas sp. NIBR11 TaxID=3015999 RepID=UPI0022F12F4F|nr:helix-turn-helix transcriptional regulator [Brevundimonas sp. NIBR11]
MVDSADLLNGAISELVREHRLARGFSQEHLASLCGLDRTYISSIERKRSNVSIEALAKIADALGVNPSELLIELTALIER